MQITSHASGRRKTRKIFKNLIAINPHVNSLGLSRDQNYLFRRVITPHDQALDARTSCDFMKSGFTFIISCMKDEQIEVINSFYDSHNLIFMVIN
jgi:hypothetical protein